MLTAYGGLLARPMFSVTTMHSEHMTDKPLTGYDILLCRFVSTQSDILPESYMVFYGYGITDELLVLPVPQATKRRVVAAVIHFLQKFERRRSLVSVH